MADKKVIVHIGEDYVTGVVDQSFLDDTEATGQNGDAYYAAASATTLIWNGTAWVAWDPNLNSNVGIATTMFGMSGAATKFGPDIGYARLLEAELGANDPLHIFKFASNATLASDATIGSWQKDPTAKNVNNDVFADMSTEWSDAKIALPNDVLRVQAIIVSHGKAEQADNTHSAAYQENLEKWLKDLRYLFLEDASDDPIPIILVKIGLTGGNYDIIRDAQDAMATALPYVNVIDMDTAHVADASDSRSGIGTWLLGKDIYDAIQTATTEDSLEEHTLASLRTSVRQEFGINAADTAQTAVIDGKLNEALLWIAKQRADWQWLLAEFSIDVPAQQDETSVSVTQGQRKVTGLTAPATLRDIFIGGTITGSDADGYLLASGSVADGFQLQSKYLGATISASLATIVKGYFKLPRDFSRMQNLEMIGNNQITERLVYKSPLEFDKIKRQRSHLQGIASNIKSFYTVKPDPLGITDDQYIVIYPFVTESRVIQGQYWKQPAKLVSAQNTPDLPRADRFVLLHAAYWFMASFLKDTEERVTFYRVQALTSLTSLIENPKFGNEPDLQPDLSPTNFINMPAGYPLPHGNLNA